jgi:cytochrome c oxidase subunit III
MNIPVLFLGVVLAIALWWLLLQKLTAKPWLEHGAEIPQSSMPFPPAAIGLGVFLAVITSLFALLTSAYYMRMMLPDWHHLPLPKLLWLNTVALALSSIALQAAWFAADRSLSDPGRTAAIRRSLLGGGVFALLFLAGQLLAWRQLSAAGYLVASNPANTFFYLFTALHGLHLLGGLLVWLRTTLRVYRGADADVAAARATAVSIKLCTAYWHYLLLIWLGLFALLSSSM